jgi:hypothetical protein
VKSDKVRRDRGWRAGGMVVDGGWWKWKWKWKWWIGTYDAMFGVAPALWGGSERYPSVRWTGQVNWAIELPV